MPQPLEPSDPARLGSYRITGRIGEGGQGVVYLGEAESGDLVAVKLFHARLGRDAAARADFTREAELARRVARFCTAQVLESGMDGGRPYIVSEYVEGPPLNQVVAARGPLSGGALERLAIGTATALVALHDAGVLHRDFKPQNVLIGPDGPRVIDFGIARALAATSTMTSQVVGTPAYMAPEQLAAGELGFALDVFAWASTITFAATGRPPFGADAIPAIINRILNQEPDLEGIEAPLRDLLAACLAKDPGRRPTAREIVDRLVRPRHDAQAAPAVPAPPGVPAAPPVSAAPAAPAAPAVSAVPHGPAESPSAGSPAPGTSPPGPPGPAGPSHSSSGASGPVTVPGGGRRRRVRAAVAAAVVAVAATAAAAVALLPSVHLPFLAAGSSATERAAAVGTAPASSADTAGGSSPSGAPSPTAASRSASPASSHRPRVSRSTVRPDTTRPAPTRTVTARPTVRHSKTTVPIPADSPAAKPANPSPTPVKRVVELGPGHFTEYCVSLGWEWVEYRETPTPGAYCVKRKGDTMYLTQSRRDAGCRWRYPDPKAFHRFKNKSNYCYTYR
ncbi:serine/threonine protein kinase [Microbispora catharanthi]|uniref:serine/threonine protein kinase n=1 Tax=Microbispora catharanthi TaxID=1712871 RepID=UPI00197B665A|nr:serine/threonine-protein kinase [Microbispora catharanthi]